MYGEEKGLIFMEGKQEANVCVCVRVCVCVCVCVCMI